MKPFALVSLCLCSLLFFASPTQAQTNTFPQNGNAGIGTTSPVSPLHIVAPASASSGAAFGGHMTSELSATANNDTLAGLRIRPFFTNGSYTGLRNYSIFGSGGAHFEGMGQTFGGGGLSNGVLDIKSTNSSLATVFNMYNSSGSKILETYNNGAMYFPYFGALNSLLIDQNGLIKGGSENLTISGSYNGVVFHSNSKQAIFQNGKFGINTISPTYTLDVLNNETGNASSNRVLNVSNSSATFNTTSGSLTSYSAYLAAGATRSEGSNSLTNIGLYASATGGQHNYAAVFDQGNVLLGATEPVGNPSFSNDKLQVTGDQTLWNNVNNGTGLRIVNLSNGGNAQTGITFYSNARYSSIAAIPGSNTEGGDIIPNSLRFKEEGAGGMVFDAPALRVTALKSGSTAPTTTGTTKMVVTDANGQVSFAPIPTNTPWTTTGNDAYYNFTGNVGIGITNPQAKLAVNGDIYSKKIKVTQSGWPDYVFSNTYHLRSLAELEAYINKFHHLPQIAPAAEIETKGLDLGEHGANLLQKVEELTLYIIDQNKKLEALEKKIQALEGKGK